MIFKYWETSQRDNSLRFPLMVQPSFLETQTETTEEQPQTENTDQSSNNDDENNNR